MNTLTAQELKSKRERGDQFTLINTLSEEHFQQTRVEADLSRLALAAEGIDAVIFDAEANSFFGGGGLISIRLMVLVEDRDEAAAILAADD